MSGFSIVKQHLISPFLCYTLWKKVNIPEAHSKRIESFVLSPWRWSIYIHYLEFFYTGNLYLCMYMYTCISLAFISLNSWIVFYILGYNGILLFKNFLAQVVPALTIGTSFSWFLYAFDITHQDVLFLWALSYFLALQDALGSSHIFSALILESVISLRNHVFFFYLKMVLETKIWMLASSALCYQGLIISRLFQLTEQGDLCMCANEYISVFNHLYVY